MFVAKGGNFTLGIYGVKPILPVSPQVVHERMAVAEGDRQAPMRESDAVLCEVIEIILVRSPFTPLNSRRA